MKRRSAFKCILVVGLALSGCKPAPDASLLTNEGDAAVSRPEPEVAPRPAGLTEDEQLQIQQDILGRFMVRTFRSGPIYAPRPADCASAFSVQNPTIGDAMLGESTGKVRVLVQITLHTIPPKRHRVPTDECYGFTAPQVTVGEPMRVPFEFKVEKWQTGWRLVQPQPGEQFQLAAR
jgi:hypothetical protein